MMAISLSSISQFSNVSPSIAGVIYSFLYQMPKIYLLNDSRSNLPLGFKQLFAISGEV